MKKYYGTFISEKGVCDMAEFLSAAEFNALKTQLKNELNRRNGYGSLSGYASAIGSDTNASVGTNPIANQGIATVNNFLRIESFLDLKLAAQDVYIPKALGANRLKNELSRLAGEQKTGTVSEVSSCRGACTGLCVGTCIGFCKGCVGSCSYTCCNACSNQCVHNCTGSSA